MPNQKPNRIVRFVDFIARLKNRLFPSLIVMLLLLLFSCHNIGSEAKHEPHCVITQEVAVDAKWYDTYHVETILTSHWGYFPNGSHSYIHHERRWYKKVGKDSVAVEKIRQKKLAIDMSEKFFESMERNLGGTTTEIITKGE